MAKRKKVSARWTERRCKELCRSVIRRHGAELRRLWLENLEHFVRGLRVRPRVAVGMGVYGEHIQGTYYLRRPNGKETVMSGHRLYLGILIEEYPCCVKGKHG